VAGGRLDTRGVIAALGEFDALLRGAGLRHGPEAWQAAHDLLLALARKQRLPDDPRALAPLLGPLFCRSPAEQARFAGLFLAWVGGAPEPATIRLAAPVSAAVTPWWRRAVRIDRRWRAGIALVTFGLIALTLWFARHEPPKPPVPPVAPPPPAVAAAELPVADEGPVIPIDDWAPPRRLPRWSGVPPDWTGWFVALNWATVGLPLLAATGFIVWHYRPRTVLQREKSETEAALNRLRIDAGAFAPFAGPSSVAALHGLRAASWEPTRRLDLAATIEATAHRAGYFQPRYRWRRTVPAYLVLVRSVHRDDQAAAFGEELVGRFDQAGLNVAAFRFREDPRHLVYWSGTERRTTTLDRLWAEQGHARLIVISEGRILFHPLTGMPRDWLPDLQRWERRAWLTTARADADLARWLWQRDFLLLPLLGLSLEALAGWFAAADRLPPPGTPAPAGDDAGMPRAIAEEPLRWLDPHPPFYEPSPVKPLGAFFCLFLVFRETGAKSYCGFDSPVR
jgi:hypothetical protein